MIAKLSWRGALPVLILIYATAYLDRQILNLLVDPIKRTLHVSDTRIGFAQGFAFVIAFTLCAVPFGAAVDRYSRRNIILFSAVAWSACAGLAGLSESYGELLLARVGVGAAEAALAPAVYSLLADEVPAESLAGILAIFSTGAIVGAGVSFAGSAYVVDRVSACDGCIPFTHGLQPWQIVIILMALPGLLFGLLAALIAEPPRRREAGHGDVSGLAETLAMIWRHRGFYLCHFFGFGLLNLLSAGWNAWAPSYLIRTLGWSVSRAGFTLGAVSITGGMIGMIGSGQLADHLYRRGVLDAHLRIYAWATLVLGAAGSIAVSTSTMWVLVPALLVITLIMPFIAVAAAALQITSPPRTRGKVSAIFLAVYNILGFGLGPAVIAFTSDTILRDAHKLWLALLLCFMLFAPIASAIFALGLKPMRAIIAAGRS